MKLIAAIAVSLSILGTPVAASAAVVQNDTDIAPRAVAQRELTWQLAHGGIGYQAWQHLAQCETEQDWNNPGRYAGGLGIYTAGSFTPKQLRDGTVGTWERWGGEQFASTPAKASIIEQIVVANRIAIFGWSTTFTIPAGWKGAPMTFDYRRPGIGVTGWGCARTHKWLKKTLCHAGQANIPSWRRHCGR